MTTQSVDRKRVREFARHLFGIYTNGLLTYLIDLGHRTGLFAAAARGRGTSAELAERAGLRERYVREWLGAMVTAEIMHYDPETGQYELPPEHAACLTGDGAKNLAPMAAIVPHLGRHLEQLEQVFRDGGGIPYSTFRPEFTSVMDELNRRPLDELLVSAWLPVVAGLTERLTEGARVADFGCGTGHALVVLGAAFPASTFVGYDIAEDALAAGRAEAAEAGLDNVRFEALDLAKSPVERSLDVVFAIDAVHDQADPTAVLRAAFDALVPGGTLVMIDMAASSELADNVGNPLSPWIYAISTLHCLPVSLAEAGAGLGAAWGEQTARRMLSDVGFVDITVRPAPGQALNAIYAARRPRADR